MPSSPPPVPAFGVAAEEAGGEASEVGGGGNGDGDGDGALDGARHCDEGARAVADISFVVLHRAAPLAEWEIGDLRQQIRRYDINK